jgi:hypothetical protein
MTAEQARAAGEDFATALVSSHRWQPKGPKQASGLTVSVKELPAFLDRARTAQTDRERGIFLQLART